MGSRHSEYSSHFESLETALTSLHVAASKSSTSEPMQLFQVRNVKLDFSRFNGSNVLEWIFRTKQFFTFYNTPEEQRLTIAAVHMEVEVIPWFQMRAKNNPFQSWISFTRPWNWNLDHLLMSALVLLLLS